MKETINKSSGEEESVTIYSNRKRPRNVETKDSGAKKKRVVSGFYRSPVASTTGKENMSPYGKRHGRSVLPSWYPRKPLQDITAIVRAIERTRTRFGESEPIQPLTTIFHEQTVHDPSAVPSSSHPPIKHEICMGEVPKLLVDVTNQNNGDSDCLAPQKKLLNNNDIAEKAAMKELPKVKRTPSGKKAEREKRVRTLMSMR